MAGAAVLPVMEAGASDSIHTMNAGIPSYGISGIAIARDDDREHGRDERVKIDAYYTGVEFYYRFLEALTNTGPMTVPIGSAGERLSAAPLRVNSNCSSHCREFLAVRRCEPPFFCGLQAPRAKYWLEPRFSRVSPMTFPERSTVTRTATLICREWSRGCRARGRVFLDEARQPRTSGPHSVERRRRDRWLRR